MSAFYVGQPVRVNCPESKQHGQETFVTRTGVAVVIHGSFLYVGIEVGIWLRRFVPGHDYCVFEHHELQPILPPGLESLDRINELYEPEPEVIRT